MASQFLVSTFNLIYVHTHEILSVQASALTTRHKSLRICLIVRMFYELDIHIYFPITIICANSGNIFAI